MGTISDNLIIGLPEVKQWLRVDDDFIFGLSQPSASGTLTHYIYDNDSMSEFGALTIGNYVTLAGRDVRIVGVDPTDRTITVDAIILEELPTGTKLTYHHQNNILMDLIDAGKSTLDTHLNNDFIEYEETYVYNHSSYYYYLNDIEPVIRIPPEIKAWVLGYIALQYGRPELTLAIETTREQGSRHYKGDIYESVEHLRRIPL